MAKVDMSKTGAEQFLESMSKIGFTKRGEDRQDGKVVSERYVHRQLNAQVEYWVAKDELHLTGEFGDNIFKNPGDVDYYIKHKLNHA